MTLYLKVYCPFLRRTNDLVIDLDRVLGGEWTDLVLELSSERFSWPVWPVIIVPFDFLFSPMF